MPTYWDTFKEWCKVRGLLEQDEYDFVGWMLIYHPEAAKQAQERFEASEKRTK